MPANRIRAVRKARGLSMDSLAEAVGSTTTTIQRLETGGAALVHELLPAIGNALDVRWEDLVSDTPPTRDKKAPIAGLAESAAPFLPPAGHLLANTQLGPTEALFESRSDELAAIGVAAGDLLICDCGREAVRDVATGDVVVVQVYGSGLTEAVTILREYIAPDFLVTNPRAGDPDIVRISDHDMAIKAVARRHLGTIRARK